MAAGLVRGERLLSLARIQILQNACARVALAIPGLHTMPRLRRETPPAPGAALPLLFGGRCGEAPPRNEKATVRGPRSVGAISSRLLRKLDACRFLPTPNPRRTSLHRDVFQISNPAQKRSAPVGPERSAFAPGLPE